MAEAAPWCGERVVPKRGAWGGTWYSNIQVDDPPSQEGAAGSSGQGAGTVICALVTNSRTFTNEQRRYTNPPLKVGDAFVHSLTEAKRELELAALGGGRLQPQGFTGRPLCTSLGKQRHGPPYMRTFHPRDTDKELNRGHQTTSRSRKTWRCDACWRVESLGHVLQVCPRTWEHRIKRHDATNKEWINGNTWWRYKTPLLFWIDIETTGDVQLWAGHWLLCRMSNRLHCVLFHVWWRNQVFDMQGQIHPVKYQWQVSQ